VTAMARQLTAMAREEFISRQNYISRRELA
jgi:hypothetical protein